MTDARLLLADGHVVELDAKGRRVEKALVQLDLGIGEAAIYAVDVDAEHNRLYVVPDITRGAGGTRVFELSSLNLVDILPGATKVFLPSNPDADVFVTWRYTPTGEQTSMSGLREIHDNPSGLTAELRSRNAPHVVLASRSAQDIAATNFECFVDAEQGFRMIHANVVLDRSLQRKVADTGSKWVEAGARPGGCWADGSTWLHGHSDTQAGSLMGRIDLATAELESVTNFTAPEGLPRANTMAFELGLKPVALVLMRGGDMPMDAGDMGVLLRFDGRKPVPLPAEVFADVVRSGYAGLSDAGASSDRRTRYLVPSRHRSGGQVLKRADRLFELSASKAVPLTELRLPEELNRVNLRGLIRADDGATAEEKRVRMERLGPLPQAFDGIHEVQVFYVLPAASDGHGRLAREADR